MRRARVAAVAALLAAGCGGHSAPPPGLDAAAESYVRLVLALAERDPDSLDVYHGPAAWRDEAHARYATLADVGAGAVALGRALATPGSERDEVRRRFLVRQLAAVAARADIVRGSRPRFADEARLLFGLDVAAAPSHEDAAAVRAAIDNLVPGRGDLAARYAAFDRAFLVPADRLAPVLARAIEGCRAATRAHVRLPPDERVEVVEVRELAWSAFTRYQGRFVSRIEVNAALPLTVDRALDLACHEAYPGHHTIDSLLDAVSPGRVELLVRPLFSPQSLLHEAAASIAGALAFPLDARIAFERDELFPLVGLNPAGAERHVRVARLVDRLHRVEADIAQRYLDGELEFARAAAALSSEALMASPDATLKFLNQYRTYAATYTVGRDLLSQQLAARTPGDQDEGGRWRSYIDAVTAPAQILPTAGAPRQ